jgi:transglutaminase-like putative cysteine protease
MDHFDGTRWTASGRVRRASTGAWGLRAEVMLEPLVGAIVYGPPDLLYATSDQGPLLQGGDGEMAHGQPGRRVAYETFSYSRPLTEADRPLPELLQLPPLDPRVRALADSLAPGRDDVASIAAAATAVFREGFVYTLDPPAPEGDPLAWFLFDSREGHCEYYASALAVLLRARGVPARLATGFYSAEYNEAGQYLSVRRGHAHAWVEVAVPGGWAVLDATPSGGLVAPEVTWWQVAEESVNAAWLSLVLDYDLRRQFDAAAALGRGFVAPLPGDPVRERSRESMAGVGVLLGVLFLSGTVLRVVLWWLARAPPWAGRTDPLVGRFRRARAVARGWAIPGELPPVAAGEWLVERAGPAGEPLLHLAQLLYRSRYGGEVVDPADVDATFRAANAIPRAR